MGIASPEHHPLSHARNWTPGILAALALSRTKELKDKVARKAQKALQDRQIDSDTLFDLWLKAKGKVKF